MSKEALKALEIGTITELEQVLVQFGIDYMRWLAGRKDISHLFTELADGETELVIDPEYGLMRQTGVLDIEVRHVAADGSEYLLYEDRQEWHAKTDADGNPRIDRRGHEWISEKIKSAEVCEDGSIAIEAVARALYEELDGVTDFENASFLKEEVEFQESKSYPGLRTKYLVYRYRVYLPESQYKPLYTEVGEEKTTYFWWKKVK